MFDQIAFMPTQQYQQQPEIWNGFLCQQKNNHWLCSHRFYKPGEHSGTTILLT